MIKYKNSYFNIELTFPEEWRLWSWFNGKVSDKSNKKFKVKYQTTDDDIPRKNGETKLLFSSIYIDKNRSEPFGAELSITACYREKATNLKDDIKKTSSETERILGSEAILGIEAQSLFTTKDMGNSHLWEKIIVWESLPNLWLEAVIHGNSQENFNHAESTFRLIKKGIKGTATR